MDSNLALSFLTSAIAIGLILYAPFYIWFSYKRRTGRQLAAGKLGEPLSRAHLPLLTAFVCILFGMMGWGEFHPDSVIGQLIRLPGGSWVLRWLAFGVLILALYLWYNALRPLGAGKAAKHIREK